jgi:hypothetical protein
MFKIQNSASAKKKNPSTNPLATRPPVIDLMTPDLPTGVKEIVNQIERASESQATPTQIPMPSASQTEMAPNGAKVQKGASSVKRIRDKNTEMSTSQ